MKTLQGIIMAVVLFIAAASPGRGQTQPFTPDQLATVLAQTPLDPATLPLISSGCWLLSALESSNSSPPLPEMPFWLVQAGAPVYSLSVLDEGEYAAAFLVDDTQTEISSGALASRAGAASSMARLSSMDDSGGGGGGASDSLIFTAPSSAYVPCESWTNFWLLAVRGSNVIDLTITNTLPGLSYLLLQATNLHNLHWTVIQTLTATNGSTAATPVNSRTNQALFFAAALTTNDQPPLIIIPPANQVVALGSNAIFTVTATGLAPLTYQWQFEGTNIPGATTNILVIDNVQTNDVGIYTVIVSNVICWQSASAGLGLIWSKNLGAAIDASPAIGEDGSVFIATTGSELFALDVFGNVKWSNSIVTGQDGDLTSSAAVTTNGIVYIGSQESGGGFLHAFNATNGALLWSTPLGGYVNSSPAISASDGTIYVGTSSGSSSNGLFAINPNTHAINWFFQTDDPNYGPQSVDSSPCVGPDCTVYFLAQNDLYAVNPDGSLQWFFPAPASSTPAGSPALDANNNILFGSSDGYVYCINPSGGLQWLFDTGTGSAINSSIAVGPDGLVVAATANGILFALTNGVLAWQFADPSSSAFVSSPAIGLNGLVVIGSEDDYVYGITNGAVAWSYQTGDQVRSSPAISPLSGAVIIGSYDGNVYSLPGAAGLAANAPWPMFHANSRHTGATPNPSCSGGASLTAFPNNPSFSSGQFSFALTGTPGSLWSVYVSSDLENWGFAGSVTLDPTSGTASFTDGLAGGLSNRFYEARSGSSCSPVIGFLTVPLAPGANLVANPLYQVNDYDWPQNTALGLSEFLANNGLPSLPDAEILKWNGQGFETNSWKPILGQWEPNGDATLLPGEAVFMNTTNAATVPFVGLVLQGVWSIPILPGTNYVSSLLPLAGRLETDLGYHPHNGDSVRLWSGGVSSTYSYSGGWSPAEPVLAAGQGFLLVAAANNAWVQTNLPCSGTFTLTPVWSTNLASLDSSNPNKNKIDASPAIGSNGIVYIPTTDNLLFALNPANGSVRWSDSNFTNAAGVEVTSSPMVSLNGATLYLGTDAGFMAALTNVLTQGQTEWSNYLGGSVFSTPALAPNGRIFVGSDEAFTNVGGAGIWEFLTNGTEVSSFCTMATNLPVAVDSSVSIGADSTLYFICEGSLGNAGLPLDFFALSTNGSVTWAFPIVTDNDDPADSSAAIDTDGTIYATGTGQYLYALNPDGSLKWAFDSGSDDFLMSSPIIGPDHTVYIGSGNRLFAVTNGVLRWAFPDPNLTSATIPFYDSTPAIDAAGTVYIGGLDNNFYAIGGNGQLKGVFPASAPIASSAVIGTNNVIYFASSDGVMNALEITAGPATNAPWPMFRQNARHTGFQPSGPALAHACGAPFPLLNSGDGLDGSGSFQFSFVGVPSTTWTVFASTNYVNWTSNGASLTVSAGAGPQRGSYQTSIGSASNEFFFLKGGDCCSKAIGFIQITLPPGTNLIADPLYQIDTDIFSTKAPNTLQTLMVLSSGAFGGVQVEEWNGAGFDTYTNDGSNWYLNGNVDGDGPLRPGQSALIITTNELTLAFVALARDGVEVAGTDYVTNYITAATNYLASILPLAGRLSTDLGFPASHGDRVELWTNGLAPATFAYTNTCAGTNWAWCPSEPVLALGQGFVLITGNTNNAWVQSTAPCYGE